ncbi:MAG: prolyl oligopeptidase family serine peptidase [Alphaproteobacteria bacterium]|nr:prolyl oligopeptidase family serine peptidase [Alphaproteobacteria bacterium]
MRCVAVCAAVLSLLFTISAYADPATDDPFIWLEDVGGARALEWVRGQNNFTVKTLKSDDDYAEAQTDAEAILTASDRIPAATLAGGQVYDFWQDRAHVRGLWRRTALASYPSSEPDWETLLDLDTLSAEQNENWVWKGAQCLPPAYRRCLVKLSRGGRDAVVVREFDVPSRSFVRGGFDVAEAKTEIAWVDTNTVMVATNWGPETLTRSGYPRVVKVWRRGQNVREAQTIYQGDASDVLVSPRTVIDSEGKVDRFIVRGLGAFGAELFNVDPSFRVTRISVPSFADFKGVSRRQLLFYLNRDWRTAGRVFLQGSLVSFSLDDYVSSGGAIPTIRTLFTPDMKTAITAVATGKDTVYVSLLENVKGRLHEISFDGVQWLWRRVPMPDNGTIDIAAASDGEGEVVLKFSNFVTPEQIYLMNRGAEPRVIKQLPARFDAYAIEVKQYEAISADGTRIPYFLVRKEDSLNNGSTPTILYAYGGFQVSTTPWYWSTAGKLWLERGGAYAVANVRGGGEFGPRWHDAATGVNRQKNIDDLAAVARDMITRGFTSSRRLGVMGASQGGLLATATFIQNPTLFNAVVAQVPLTDMLRYPRLSAGASWLAEYGDPSDPMQRAAILRWSPYHNIKAGVKYPRAFFLASTRDDRVHPAHARKMAAKLQANGHPYLYFETTDGGHDAARTLRQRAEQLALTFTYFRQQLMD